MKKFIILLIVLCLCSCSKYKNYSFELEGNPTTGYEWICLSSDKNIMEVETSYNPSDDSLLGVGGKYLITLKGVTSGMVTLNCQYKRSFEENSDIQKSKKYNFIVDENLNVIRK